ncbi:DNA polymerase III subunit gamma/tau [bacterium]|nr:DNA polymerase III subunit gamma/tau [bacterium]
MSYQVIARKWRPQTFDEIVGQSHIGTTLRNSIKNGRVAHAFIFTGVRGVGKTTTARILAKAINCENSVDANPCNRCKSCIDIQKGTHIDVTEIDGASNTGIDDIKVLREASRYLPSQSRYKIYIIDEVHMLSEKAFNALLKTLEEPPAHVKFIFATTDPHKIPITIRSRCQVFDFKAISPLEISQHLQHILSSEGIEATEEALYLIARKAEGSMRDAQSLTDQVIAFAQNHITKEDVLNVLGLTDTEELFNTVDAIAKKNIPQLIHQTEKLIHSGISLSHFYKELINHFHILLMVRTVSEYEEILKIPKFELENYVKQATLFNDSFFYLYEILLNGFQELKISQFPRITFEFKLIQLAKFEPITPLSDILKLLEQLSSSIETSPDLGEIPINIFNNYSFQTELSLSDKNLPQKNIIKQSIPTANNSTEKKNDLNHKELDNTLNISEKNIDSEKKNSLNTTNSIISEKDKLLENSVLIEQTNNINNSIPIIDVIKEPNSSIKNERLDTSFEKDSDFEELINFEKKYSPFFKNQDNAVFSFFYEKAKISINESENECFWTLPTTAESIIDLYGDFRKIFGNWLNKELIISFSDFSNELSFENQKERYIQYVLKQEKKEILELPEIQNLKDRLNLMVDDIYKKK